MFLILSFDFENSSSVNLHCMTKNIESANNTYTSILNQILTQNDKELLELIEVGEEFHGALELVEVDEEFDGAYCFYWGQEAPGVKILRSTNRNKL
jgi:hypothetical protein